jgi:hypothetical protein
MPGARVQVSGRYTIRGESLDFRGQIELDARLSRLTTGVKSFLLRMIDGLFRYDDVTIVPITVGGTARQPSVKLDFKRAFTRSAGK